jgi:hypothetical protein
MSCETGCCDGKGRDAALRGPAQAQDGCEYPGLNGSGDNNNSWEMFFRAKNENLICCDSIHVSRPLEAARLARRA